MVDRTRIGTTSEPRSIDVEKGMLRLFALATGESDPIYTDENAARAAGHRSLPAPPTYTMCLSLGAPAKRGDLLEDFRIDPAAVRHAGQAFTHHHFIYAGDRITLTTVTSDIVEKKGGALTFVVQDTRAVNQDGLLCAEMRMTVAILNTDA